MNPYTKAVRFIVRMIAFAFILFGALPLGADYLARGRNNPGSGKLWVLLEVLSLVLGLILLFTSSAIAKKLTEDFEE